MSDFIPPDSGSTSATPKDASSHADTVLYEKSANYGTSQIIVDLGATKIDTSNIDGAKKAKLGQLAATAICGNDITSSCLYVSALCAMQAGPYAPIALAVVAVVLYLFRKIYGEVGSALPLNGGAYNALLNTSTKAKASIAACLTILSYIATAVISANEAMHYAHNLYEQINVMHATVGLLGLFAFLSFLGITESAAVAVMIFIFHIATLIVLSAVAIAVVLADPSTFIDNWNYPLSKITGDGSFGLAKAVFFGFAAALLGISGFESSANFIEEQKPGVFLKTLRNMWIAVAIFNPLISVLSLGLIPLDDMGAHKNDLLAHMGWVSGGKLISDDFGSILKYWVSIDAVLVLSGAVLTGYVGVVGLVRRMSLDRCLPQFLLIKNKLRGTNHWIVIAFLMLCISILYITEGDVTVLGGVYTLSFLGVMGLFAIGNMLLKIKRGRLPRDVRASWLAVVIALVAVVAGVLGNLLLSPENAKIFVAYFAITLLVVGIMFARVQILRIVLYASSALVEQVTLINSRVRAFVVQKIDAINSHSVVFFTRGDDAANLNRAALYVLANEQTKTLKIVHVFKNDEDIPPRLGQDLKMIDDLYADLRIDFLSVKGEFTPELIERLSKRLGVPKNYMFIGCPGNRFPIRIAQLGGVRLII